MYCAKMVLILALLKWGMEIMSRASA
jgi:hypothetical protein